MKGQISAPRAHQLASQCGMPVSRWHGARGQAQEARTRGRRATGTARSLEEWGPVEGQAELFGGPDNESQEE